MSRFAFGTMFKSFSFVVTAVDGEWGLWSHWGPCDMTCGGGLRTRVRKCDNPAPKFGGLQCPGYNVQSEICNKQPCPTGNYLLYYTLVNIPDMYSLYTGYILITKT